MRIKDKIKISFLNFCSDFLIDYSKGNTHYSKQNFQYKDSPKNINIYKTTDDNTI
jgi:hypothetical protein